MTAVARAVQQHAICSRCRRASLQTNKCVLDWAPWVAARVTSRHSLRLQVIRSPGAAPLSLATNIRTHQGTCPAAVPYFRRGKSRSKLPAVSRLLPSAARGVELKKSETVEDNEQARAHVGEDGHPQGGRSGDGKNQEHCLDHQRCHDILLEDGRGLFA